MERKPTYAELIAAGVSPEEARRALKETVEWVEREQKVILPLKDQEAALKAGREARQKLITGLSDALKDEHSAGAMYLNLAKDAVELDQLEEANKLREIALDEFRHRDILKEMIQRLRR